MADALRPLCFVIAPINDWSDRVLARVIRPVMEQGLGYEVLRGDQDSRQGSVLDAIRERIETADIVIFDVTGANPNAMFEAGYSYALKRPFIQVARVDQELPFNVQGNRTIFIDLSTAETIEDAKQKLALSARAVSHGTPQVEEARHTDNAPRRFLIEMSPRALSSLDLLHPRVIDSALLLLEDLARAPICGAPVDETRMLVAAGGVPPVNIHYVTKNDRLLVDEIRETPVS